MTDKWQSADWNLFAMGALEEGTQRAMQEHLRTRCRACNRSYQEAVLVMDALAATVPVENPSPHIADVLLARIGQPAPPVVPTGASRKRRKLMLPWVAAAACALLALWLGVRLEHVSGLLRQQNASLQPAAVPQPLETAPSPAPVGEPAKRPSSSPPADTASLRAKRAQARALSSQLADLQSQKDAALAQLGQLKSDLAHSIDERDRLQSQLASAQEQIRTGTHAGEAQVALLFQQLEVANRTIAELKAGKAWSAQVVAFLQGGPFRQVELRGVDPGAGKATAVAFYAPDRGLLVLARSLPQLDQEKCYQLWSLHKAGPAILSVGLLKTDTTGSGFLYAPPGQDLRQLTGLAITDEPKGGSVAAQGHKLLFGALN
jgi:anti-sigma-K factor RskA